MNFCNTCLLFMNWLDSFLWIFKIILFNWCSLIAIILILLIKRTSKLKTSHVSRQIIIASILLLKQLPFMTSFIQLSFSLFQFLNCIEDIVSFLLDLVQLFLSCCIRRTYAIYSCTKGISGSRARRD